MRWLVLVVRLAGEPTRHRVAVWRELRGIGAVPLGHGAWAVPALPLFTERIARVGVLVARGDGELLQLDATGREGTDSARLESLFTAAREAEWAEFLSECGKYEAELDKEVSTEKFTVAELEEEEQSLERLRRWYRELKTRDVFGAPSAAAAEQRLKECAERLEDYSDQVFRAVHEW